MTDRLRAAAQAALEALEMTTERFLDTQGSYGTYETEAVDAAYAAQDVIRAALAEPEAASEPFVWYDDDTGETWTPGAVQDGGAPDGLRPLYTAPPRREWQPLTDEEIEQIADEIPVDGFYGPATWHIKLSRAIEAALKDKNHD